VGTAKCAVGAHRWTFDDSNALTCFRCGRQRIVGKTMRCRLGMHHWVGVSKDGGEPYRECSFCRKYGGSPRPPQGGA
jgi:hypothetical protein